MGNYIKFLKHEDLEKRITWLITLRWIAIVGLFIAISGSYFILKVPLSIFPLYLGNFVLTIYNLICALYFKRLTVKVQEKENRLGIAYFFTNFQISFDLVLLAYLLYFAGGFRNPFTLFFLFHMVIASIILTNRAAFLQATFAVFLYVAVF